MVYWALQFVQGPASPISAAVAAPSPGAGSVDAQALAKGLGGGQESAPASNLANPALTSVLQASRFVLTGVVVNKQSSLGVALIAVDGKPQRPYRVGSQLTDGVVLHSVAAGKAMLALGADAAPSLTLALPPLTSAVVGTAVVARPLLATTANQAANPTPASVQRPARIGANRPREADREAQKPALSPAPAQ